MIPCKEVKSLQRKLAKDHLAVQMEGCKNRIILRQIVPEEVGSRGTSSQKHALSKNSEEDCRESESVRIERIS